MASQPELPAPDAQSPELHSMVHSYLATLLALSDALEAACPPVGGPHQQRIGRLRTRLSFDSNKAAIEASSNLVRSELQDFAAKSLQYVTVTTGEWKQAAEEIRTLGAGLIKRQRFYANRMRELAEKLDDKSAPLLTTCAESMDNEAQSMLSRMQVLLAGVETRLAEIEVVDHSTGLMNRRELERRIELQRAAGEHSVPLLFKVEFDGPPNADPVLRQIAARLTAQLRPEDLIGRWSEMAFLVLFQAAEGIAERRAPQVAERLNGSYPVADGGSVTVRASVSVLDRELIPS
jgi:GGDEF domain-containing protein